VPGRNHQTGSDDSKNGKAGKWQRDLHEISAIEYFIKVINI
jgi:hypothetical protein